MSRPKPYLPVLFAGFVLLAAADVLCGGGGFSWAEGPVLWKLRIPRVLTALCCGGALAVAGAGMQSLFRNPLADPHILGVSGGAGLGAAVAVVLLGSAWPAFSGVTMVLAAFAGAALTSLLLLAVSRRLSSGPALLIFGVLLGFLLSALTSILQYTAHEEGLKLFYSWMAGSFSGSRYTDVALMGAGLLTGSLLLAWRRKGLDLLLFGDSFAALAGADVPRLRRSILGACCLLTAAVTAFCGPIGFIGIIAPHIARRLTGSSAHRDVLPAALLGGDSLALLADILSQLAGLPAGSAVALLGLPLLLPMLLRNP